MRIGQVRECLTAHAVVKRLADFPWPERLLHLDEVLPLLKQSMVFWRFAVAGSVAWAVHHWFGAATILDMVIAISISGVVYLLLVIPYVWTTPLRGYIQNATASLTSAMRTRVPGWSGKA